MALRRVAAHRLGSFCVVLVLASCSAAGPASETLPTGAGFGSGGLGPAGGGALPSGGAPVAGGMTTGGALLGSGGATTGGALASGGATSGGATFAGGAVVTGGAASGGETTAEPPPVCKRGLGEGYHSVADLTALSAGVHWWYNWSPRPDAGVGDTYRGLGVEFVPMAWGNFDESTLRSQVPSDATMLLGFNEPNFFAQANFSASEAASRWPALERVADALSLRIASPAVNFCGPANACHDTDPFSYLDDFFAACQGCRVDVIAAHWYACDGPALEWYLGELKQYGKPIWLTEFSCGDGADRSLSKQMSYMKDAVAILEAETQVERYAWFSGRTTAIPNVDVLGADGQLTELGKQYVALPHHDPRCAR